MLYVKVSLFIDHSRVGYALLCAMIAGHTCFCPILIVFNKIELFFDGRFMQYLFAIFYRLIYWQDQGF